jgi:hypothetical protein
MLAIFANAVTKDNEDAVVKDNEDANGDVASGEG